MRWICALLVLWTVIFTAGCSSTLRLNTEDVAEQGLPRGAWITVVMKTGERQLLRYERVTETSLIGKTKAGEEKVLLLKDISYATLKTREPGKTTVLAVLVGGVVAFLVYAFFSSLEAL